MSLWLSQRLSMAIRQWRILTRIWVVAEQPTTLMTETQTLLCHSRKLQISGAFFRQWKFEHRRNGIKCGKAKAIIHRLRARWSATTLSRRHNAHETRAYTGNDDDGWSMTIPISNKIDREIIMGWLFDIWPKYIFRSIVVAGIRFDAATGWNLIYIEIEWVFTILVASNSANA